MVGEKYNWYEKVFLNKSYWLYILFLVSLCIGFATVICLNMTCVIVCCLYIKKKCNKVKIGDSQIKPRTKMVSTGKLNGLELEETNIANFRNKGASKMKLDDIDDIYDDISRQLKPTMT